MRSIYLAAMFLALVGCSSTSTLTPREYLDEQTAATIKVVADPLVFAEEPGSGQRDFLNVYAIDVNRMGAHQQYLAVLQWWPAPDAATQAATLVLETSGGTLTLEAAKDSARELGIAQRIDASAPRDAVWRYFPVSKDVLATVSRAGSTRATLISEDQRVVYALWRDGRAELAELTAILP